MPEITDNAKDGKLPDRQPPTEGSPAPASISQEEIADALHSAREQMGNYDGRPLANACCEAVAFALRRHLPALAPGNLLDFELLVIDACARDIAKLVEADFADAVDDILWSIEDNLT